MYAGHGSRANLQLAKPKELEIVKGFQNQKCIGCNDSDIQHRIQVHSEEDKQRLGIPIVPANDNLKFLYRCCVQGCPFQSIRHLKNASAFHAHMQKHPSYLTNMVS